MTEHIPFQMINSIDTPEYWGINLCIKYRDSKPVFNKLSKSEIIAEFQKQAKKFNSVYPHISQFK